MLDLYEIMTKYQQLNINEFFQIQAKVEFSNKDKRSCKIEQALESDRFSIFSDKASQFFKLNQDECGINHPINNYLTNYIIDKTGSNQDENGQKKSNLVHKMKLKDLKDKERYIVEYTFIDFEYMILGEKIKQKTLEDGKIPSKRFDDFHLANIMMASNDNLKFYEQPSV